ncbi:hypothetical protein B484DRAFT_451165 [Ochromonadaceae sp. CCMP2298]|nr:hypothetical protein B484DRAFT_451165 [Ochromonadaceae sp. CCMP2298]|eukprot:CAMPEP_0173271878 /NCGR_PEP_ID=MMETSP1143-20121109/1057_1 /TAXON_ID=483371 /ORGANISM="non described non described, Strain CCMP2298" /LENGTH=143 /DNA_ID=CAMNT_0014208483 /DNA_START=138 /DNA_END=569 /DNA_ORIENTATION=-
MDELSKAVEKLLTLSRDEIAGENPQQALAAVLHAVRLTQGEDAIIQVLNQAKSRAEAAIDQQVQQERLDEAYKISTLLLQQDTILSESGDQCILRDAFEDGSSVLCTNCGGLVARVRWESHSQLWCPALDGSAHDGDDGAMET